MSRMTNVKDSPSSKTKSMDKLPRIDDLKREVKALEQEHSAVLKDLRQKFKLSPVKQLEKQTRDSEVSLVQNKSEQSGNYHELYLHEKDRARTFYKALRKLEKECELKNSLIEEAQGQREKTKKAENQSKKNKKRTEFDLCQDKIQRVSDELNGALCLLEAKINPFEQRIEKLQRRNSKEITALKSLVKQLERGMKAKQDKIVELSRRYSTLKETTVDSETAQGLRDKINELENKRNIQQTQDLATISSLKAKISQKEDEFLQLNKKNLELSLSIDNAKRETTLSQNKAIEDLEKKLRQSSDKIHAQELESEALMQRNTDLMKQINQITEMNLDLKKSSQTREDKVLSIGKENERLKEYNAQYEKNSNLMKASVEQLKEELYKINTQYEFLLKRSDKFQSKIKSLKLERHDANADKSQLTRYSELLIAKEKEIHELNARFGNDISELESKHQASIEQLTSQIELVNKERSTSLTAISQKEKDLTEVNNQLNTAISEVKSLNTTNIELKDDIKNKENFIKDLRTEIELLNDKCTKAENLLADNIEIKNTENEQIILKFNQKLENAKQDNEKLKQEHSEKINELNHQNQMSITQLQGDIKQSEKEKQEILEKLSEQLNLNHKLNTEAGESKQERNNIFDLISEKEKLNKQLNEMVQEYKQKITRSHSEKEELNQQLATKAKEHEIEKQTIIRQLSTLESNENELKGIIQRYEHEKQEIRDKLSEQEKLNSQLNTQIQDLQGEISENERFNINLQQENKNILEQISQMEISKTHLSHKLEESETNYQHTQTLLETEIISKEENIQKLSEELKRHKKTQEEYQEQILKLKEEKTEILRKLEESEQFCNSINTENSEIIEQMRLKYKNTEDELKKENKEIQNLKGQLASELKQLKQESSDSISNLTQQLSEAQLKIDQLVLIENECVSVKDDYFRLKENYEALEAKLMNAHELAKSLQIENEHLTKQSENKTEDLTSHKSQNYQLQTKIQNLMTELENKQEELNITQIEVEKLKDANKDKENTIKQFEEEVSAQQELEAIYNKKHQETVQQLNQYIDDLKNQINALNNEKNDLIAQKDSETKTLTGIIHDKEELNRKMESDISKMNEKLKDVSEKLKDISEKYEDLNAKLNETEKMNQEYPAKLEKLKSIHESNIQEKDAEIKVLVESRKESEMLIAEQKEKLQAMNEEIDSIDNRTDALKISYLENEQIQTLKEEIDQLKHTIQESDSVQNNYFKQIHNLQEELELTKETYKEHLDTLDIQIINLESANKQLTDDLKSADAIKNKEIKQFKDEIDKLAEFPTKYEEVKQIESELMDKLEAKEDRIYELESKLGEIKIKMFYELEQRDEQIDNLQTEVLSLKASKLNN